MNYSWVDDFLANPECYPHAVQGGHYHRNYVLRPPGGEQPVLVRQARAQVPTMDLRSLDECTVLRFLERANFPAPRVLYEEPSGQYMVLSYIPGRTLAELYPAGAVLPEELVHSAASLLSTIHQLDLPEELAARALSPENFINFIEKIYLKACLEGWDKLFEKLCFPEPGKLIPSTLRDSLCTGATNPVFVHSDLNRANLIVGNGEALVPIDWELAAVAEPAIDVSAHIHRSQYNRKQLAIFLESYVALTNFDHNLLRSRTALYLDLEVLKSVVVDTLRVIGKLRKAGASNLMRLAARLNYANRLWGIEGISTEQQICEQLYKFVKI